MQKCLWMKFDCLFVILFKTNKPYYPFPIHSLTFEAPCNSIRGQNTMILSLSSTPSPSEEGHVTSMDVVHSLSHEPNPPPPKPSSTCTTSLIQGLMFYHLQVKGTTRVSWNCMNIFSIFSLLVFGYVLVLC